MAGEYGFETTFPADSGTTGGGGGPTGFLGSASTLLANPAFQGLLGGVGARLDPQGVGGALGGALQTYLNQQALQKVAATTQQRQDKRHDELLAALSRVHTPAGAEGRTWTNISRDKIVTKGNRGDTEYTETQPIPATAPQTPGDYSTAIPEGTPPVTSSPLSSSTVAPTGPSGNEARNFYPFSQALLG